DSECLWDNLKEADLKNWEEFEELFSKQTKKQSPTEPKAKNNSKAKEVAKLLDQKRSQNVGILISSLHLDISEIQNATIHICTSRCTLYNMAGDTPAQASVIRFRSSCNISGGVAYTRCLMYPHRKRSDGFRSGERGGHSTQPPYPMVVAGMCPECTVGHLTGFPLVL
ncbi:hypothetical protein AVEN_196149-1, partial [Araneus ventricosus]